MGGFGRAKNKPEPWMYSINVPIFEGIRPKGTSTSLKFYIVLPKYSTAKRFRDQSLDQLSIYPEQAHANIQKATSVAEISRQAQVSRLLIVRAARYFVLQIVVLQVVQASTLAAQDVGEAMVETRQVSVSLVMVAVVFFVVVIVGLALVVEMMVAVAVALLVADHGVARTLSCKTHWPNR